MRQCDRQPEDGSFEAQQPQRTPARGRLADSVTGVTSATVGASVVTVAMTMNFIRTAKPGETIRVTSRITHNGRTTIVIEADMFDEEDHLMANILATMMVVDHFPEIPREWKDSD